jgi:hypothetical protein
MVFDSDFATHLKMLNMTDLVDGPMALLNMPMFVMLFGEFLPDKGSKLPFIGQEYGVMARLVFQPRPKQLHMTELLKPDYQYVVGDVQRLHLHPLTFFQGKEPTQLMVFYPFQVVHATVPTVPVTIAGSSPQANTSSNMSSGNNHFWSCLPTCRIHGS